MAPFLVVMAYPRCGAESGRPGATSADPSGKRIIVWRAQSNVGESAIALAVICGVMTSDAEIFS